MTTSPEPEWKVELLLLGIGGAFDADLHITNTNALVTVSGPNDRVVRVLLDCGHTCGGQLNRLGLTYNDIDAVLVTHAHGDHIDGLEVLGYKSRFLYNRSVPVYTPQGVMDDIWHSLQAKMGWLQIARGKSVVATMADYFEPVVVTDERFSIADGQLNVTFFAVEHVAEMATYGILLQVGDDGPVIRWSGDTIFDADSVLFSEFSKERGDLIFHDCAFSPYYDTTVHTHFEQLEGLSEDIRERLVLIHHGRVEPSPEPIKRTTLGQPLQSFTLSKP